MNNISQYFSAVPALFLTQVVLISIAARKAEVMNAFRPMFWLLASLAIWGILVSAVALAGSLETEAFVSAYPLLWLPFVPVVLVMTQIMFSARTRDAVRATIDATPMTWLVGVHGLRILAIGSMIKAGQGEFSMSFATYVGGPDLLFGLSAIPMVWLVAKKRVGEGMVLGWQLLGALVIVPSASIVGQMSLPGVFYKIVEMPTAASLFDYPMVLAPSLVVPLFVTMNLLVAVRLIERKFQSGRVTAS